MAKHLVKDSKFIEELAEMSSNLTTAQLLGVINDTAFKTALESRRTKPIAGNDLIVSMRELKESL